MPQPPGQGFQRSDHADDNFEILLPSAALIRINL
jgi:hypothetical protein